MHRTEFSEPEEQVNREVMVSYIDHRGACCLRQIPLTGLAALILNNTNAPRKRSYEEALQTRESFRR